MKIFKVCLTHVLALLLILSTSGVMNATTREGAPGRGINLNLGEALTTTSSRTTDAGIEVTVRDNSNGRVQHFRNGRHQYTTLNDTIVERPVYLDGQIARTLHNDGSVTYYENGIRTHTESQRRYFEDEDRNRFVLTSGEDRDNVDSDYFYVEDGDVEEIDADDDGVGVETYVSQSYSYNSRGQLYMTINNDWDGGTTRSVHNYDGSLLRSITTQQWVEQGDLEDWIKSMEAMNEDFEIDEDFKEAVEENDGAWSRGSTRYFMGGDESFVVNHDMTIDGKIQVLVANDDEDEGDKEWEAFKAAAIEAGLSGDLFDEIYERVNFNEGDGYDPDDFGVNDIILIDISDFRSVFNDENEDGEEEEVVQPAEARGAWFMLNDPVGENEDGEEGSSLSLEEHANRYFQSIPVDPRSGLRDPRAGITAVHHYDGLRRDRTTNYNGHTGALESTTHYDRFGRPSEVWDAADGNLITAYAYDDGASLTHIYSFTNGPRVTPVDDFGNHGESFKFDPNKTWDENSRWSWNEEEDTFDEASLNDIISNGFSGYGGSSDVNIGDLTNPHGRNALGWAPVDEDDDGRGGFFPNGGLGWLIVGIGLLGS